MVVRFLFMGFEAEGELLLCYFPGAAMFSIDINDTYLVGGLVAIFYFPIYWE